MASDAERFGRFEGHDYPQELPAPDEVRVGGPAPWAHLSSSKRTGVTLERVVSRLRDARQHLDVAPLPGEPREAGRIAEARRQPITRRSAVLVALFEENGETHVILTRRAFHLRHHRGEIAFPGGRSEEGEDLISAALRETQEEVGIEPGLVTPAGWLHPIVTFASGSAIWPVVGLLEGRPQMTIDANEVDRAFTVSLAHLLDEANFLEEHWRRDPVRPGSDAEGYFPIYLYRVPGDLIWGATSRILTELLCVVTGTPWPDADRMWG